MALPLETEVCNYPEHGIEITLKHRHGDIAMIFMHRYIYNIILEWDVEYRWRNCNNNISVKL